MSREIEITRFEFKLNNLFKFNFININIKLYFIIFNKIDHLSELN